jgi:hypothetical protein
VRPSFSRRAFLALSGSLGALNGQEKKRPNVLLILADDLGFSDLGCYGGEIDTPNLNRLASNGVRWSQFYTTARCCPSRASLLSGQYPHRVGVGHMVTDLGQPGYRGRLSENAATIAEVLRPSGYRTFISGKWHVGTNDPTQHGFEQFYGTLISASTFWDPAQYLRLPRGSRMRPTRRTRSTGPMRSPITHWTFSRMLAGRPISPGSCTSPTTRPTFRCMRVGRISRNTRSGTRWGGTRCGTSVWGE